LTSASQISEPSTVFARSAAVVTRTIAGETLLIPVRGTVGDLASIYSFNATATTVWEALVEPMRFDEIVKVVMREYNVTEVQATSDVQQFLDEMSAAGLVSTRAVDSDAQSVSAEPIGNQ
jgi:Coenzyme PQQ synthesis protein D (PqqD)